MMAFSNKSKLEQELPRKKIKDDDLESDIAPDNLLSMQTPELGVDELSLILRSYWISTKDLLNFRLVNTIWCDAATSILLQRDACFGAIKINFNEIQACLQKQKQNNERKIGQLTDLMSHSRKFPLTDFRIQTSVNVNTPSDYSDYPELLHFFELHGGKIKTLGPHGWISQKCLLDIFFVYTPGLECLDLSQTKLRMKSYDLRDDLRWVSKALPCKSLRFGFHHKDGHYISDSDSDSEEEDGSDNNDEDEKEIATDRKIIHLLLSSPSKLSSIENVTLGTLHSILRERKVELVRSFEFILSHLLNSFKPTVTQFVQLNPKLVMVTLNLEVDCFEELNIDVPLINAFIKSFKDTVQNLSLQFCFNRLASGSPFKIPPMKKLQSIFLTGCDEFRPNAVNLRPTIFKFEEGISANDYFPYLRKVNLNSENASHVQGIIMSFFAFISESDGLISPVWDYLSTVEVLKIRDTAKDLGFNWNTHQGSRPIKAPPFSEMFPNIRICKLRVDQATKLDGSWWKICPNVEFMEIIDLGQFHLDPDDEIQFELSLLIDKFITGFSLEMCFKLRTTELSQEILDNPELLQSFRVSPTVYDLRHLKELKLRFTYELQAEFATRMTGKYAFSKMPNTKFIISYNPKTLTLNSATHRAYVRRRTNAHSSSSDSSDESENGEGNGLVNDGNNDDVGQNQNVENFDEEMNNDDETNNDGEIEIYEERCFGSLRPYAQIVREEYPDDWK